MDDNVHMRNPRQFAYEPRKAAKQLDLMLHPRQRHGIFDPAQNAHLRQKMLEFTLEHLRPRGKRSRLIAPAGTMSASPPSVHMQGRGGRTGRQRK